LKLELNLLRLLSQVLSSSSDHHSSSSFRPSSHSSLIDPETLSNAVRSQVEYYFSKENLRTDTFLQSKMDAQSAVPLATVMAVSFLLFLSLSSWAHSLFFFSSLGLFSLCVSQ
jgi:hypothetical protein